MPPWKASSRSTTARGSVGDRVRDTRPLYDRRYFLSDLCEGFDEFRHGSVSAIKARQVAMLDPGPGRRVLDAGCGRGEVLLACARRGASVAAADFSGAALEITGELLSGYETDLREACLTALPWPDGTFDAVLSGDVIEHLYPNEAGSMLRELRRVLRPGGRLVLHTAPNRLFLELTWPLARRPMRSAGLGETVARLDEWIAASKLYHLNEQHLHGLRRALRRAGFRHVHAWVDPDVLRSRGHHLTAELPDRPLVRAAGRIAGSRPLRLIAGNDLWAVAHVE
jgi:ubiquinone/menaquinone biosynthesis C-methylase UbiE